MGSFFHKYLIKHKLFYLLFGFLFYVCYYFRGQYFKHVLHINEGKFGGFSAGISLLTFFVSFLWTRLADGYNIHRKMLITFAILSSISFSLLSLNGITFVSAMVLAGFYVLFGMAMPPLVDKIVLDDLSANNLSKDLYANQRLFAIVSYGLVTLGISYLIQIYGYSVIFTCLALFTVLFVLFTIFFTSSPPATSKLTEVSPDAAPVVTKSPDSGSKPNLLKAVSNIDYIFFLFVILINGFSRFFMNFFLNLYLTETVTMTPVQSAASAALGLSFEIFMFTRAHWLLDTIGIYWMITLGQLAMVVRIWAYYLIPARIEFLYLFFVVELLKGVNMGFVQPSAVKLSSHFAPKGLEGTFQGIYFGVFSGLGGFFAGLYANLFLTDKNFNSLLFFIAVLMTVVMILFFIRYNLYEKYKATKSTSAVALETPVVTVK